MHYPSLFQPITLRNLTIPNRLVMPPMSTQLGSPDGQVTAKQVAFYEARAKGGTGMIIVEFCCVHPDSGQSEPNQLSLLTPAHVESHRLLVNAIRAEGSVACLQLQHGGGSAKRSLLKVPTPWGPCDITSYKNPEKLATRAMSAEEIEMIIESFGRAAELGVEAGYQAVELHGAHGYLITQFLSPRFNQRDDEWGGSESNRLRFVLRVIERTRQAIGERPLILRISADEFTPTGLTIEDMERIAPILVAAGLDAIHVSIGIGPDSFDKVLEPMSTPEGWRIPYARRIREATGVPVIAVGQIRIPETAEQAVANNDADMIALGRTLLADPDWANKAKAGYTDEIIPCTSCNFCVTNGFMEHSIACADNPRTGRELEPLPTPQTDNRRAVVVGGGPGGIKAALLLDQADFKVELIESRRSLGGGLIASAAPPKKQLITRFQSYLENQLKNSNVQVTLNQAANAEVISQSGAKIVILANGTPTTTAPKNLDTHHCLDAYSLLMGDTTDLPTTNQGVIAVYGGGETGCETAEYLLERGYDVILISRSPKQKLARAAEMIYRGDLLTRLRSHSRLTLLDNTAIEEISEDKIFVCTRESNEVKRRSIATSAVVLAQGRQPDNTLQTELESKGINCITIGDARKNGRIGDAIHDAYQAVVNICDQ